MRRQKIAMIAGAPMTNPEISNPVKVEPPEKKEHKQIHNCKI